MIDFFLYFCVQQIKIITDMATSITDATFEEIIKTNKVVLIDFWAEWCGPCRMVGPIVEELAGEYEGKAMIGKLDVDENPDVCEKYGIRNIPTLLYFKDGEMVDKVVGAAQKAVLKEKIDTLL
jgi:thioredoxin 1